MIELNFTQAKVYELIKKAERDKHALVALTGKNSSYILQTLKVLVENGMAEVLGVRRFPRYKGIEKEYVCVGDRRGQRPPSDIA